MIIIEFFLIIYLTPNFLILLSGVVPEKFTQKKKTYPKFFIYLKNLPNSFFLILKKKGYNWPTLVVTRPDAEDPTQLSFALNKKFQTPGDTHRISGYCKDRPGHQSSVQKCTKLG